MAILDYPVNPDQCVCLSFFLSNLLNYGKVDGLDSRTHTYEPAESCRDLGRV